MEESRMLPRNSPITLNLSKDDFIIIFRACEDRRAKLHQLQTTSNDEDVIADAGNDLIEITMIIKNLNQKGTSSGVKRGGRLQMSIYKDLAGMRRSEI